MGRIGWRQATSACLGRRLEELSTILDEAAKTGRLPTVGEIGTPGAFPWNLRSWSGVVSGQVLPHFPRQEADRYSAEALQLDRMPPRVDAELQAWMELRAMIGPGRPLGESELIALRAANQAAYEGGYALRLNVESLAQMVRDTRLLSDKELQEAWRYGQAQGAQRPVCNPMTPAGDRFAPYRPLMMAPAALPLAAYDDPDRPYVRPQGTDVR